MHNENDDPRTFAVAQGGWSLDYTLTGGALATFTWPGSRPLQPADRLVIPQSAAASVSPDTAAAAIDDDASTSWSTGATQQVDLARPTRVHRVVLDTGVAVGNFPNARELVASADGVHWGRAVARGYGAGQLTTAEMGGRGRDAPVRHLKVVLTGSAPVGWNVADLRVYR